MSPLGERLVLRTASRVFVLDIPGDSLAEAFEAEPVAIFETPTDQGEAITFGLSGDGLWMVDEGENSPLWHVECLDFDASTEDAEDPLLVCDAVTSEPSCGCSGGEVAWLWLLCIL